MQGSTLVASYFDGQTAKAQAVLLRMVDGDLLVSGDGVERRVNAADVQWPERTRHGVRVAHFANGGSVQCSDAQAWDLWRQQSGCGAIAQTTRARTRLLRRELWRFDKIVRDFNRLSSKNKG